MTVIGVDVIGRFDCIVNTNGLFKHYTLNRFKERNDKRLSSKRGTQMFDY